MTNTTSRPRSAILERLRRLGFALADGELLTPGVLAVRLCRRARPPPRRRCSCATTCSADFAGLERRRRRRRRGDRRRHGRRLRLRAPQPRLPAPDRRRRADRAAEQPLLDDARRARARRRPVRRRARVRRADRGRGRGQAGAGVLRDGARRARRARPPMPSWSATTSRATSAARSRPGSPPCSSAPASTARTPLRASGIEPTAIADSIADVPALLARHGCTGAPGSTRHAGAAAFSRACPGRPRAAWPR